MSQPPSKQGSGRRSRIVIDVAQAQAEARNRPRQRGKFGRGAKMLSAGALAVAVLLVALLAGGYFWWRSYTKSPAYSLALLVDAAQRDDVKAVEGLIDSDRVAQGFAPQVLDKLAAGAGNLPSTPARAQVEAALPLLLPRVRETMREEVARGIKGFAEKSGGYTPFVFFAVGLSRAADIKEQGDTATAMLKAADRSVELGMQRDGERWKIVNVKDDTLASDIAARLVASLPAPPGAQPRPTTTTAPRRKSAR